MVKTNGWVRVARSTATVCIAAVLGCAGFGLVGCANSYEQDITRITSGVAQELDALQGVDAATATSLLASDLTTQFADAGVDVGAFYQTVLSGMTYELGTAAVSNDGSQITVQLAITAKNGNTALQVYAATLANELASSAGRDALAALSDAELDVYVASELQAAFDDASVKLVTTDVTLVYQKDDGTWTLQNPEELASALMGGLSFAQAAAVTDDQIEAAADTAAANVDALVAAQAPAEEVAEGEWAADEQANA